MVAGKTQGCGNLRSVPGLGGLENAELPVASEDGTSLPRPSVFPEWSPAASWNEEPIEHKVWADPVSAMTIHTGRDEK